MISNIITPNSFGEVRTKANKRERSEEEAVAYCIEACNRENKDIAVIPLMPVGYDAETDDYIVTMFASKK